MENNKALRRRQMARTTKLGSYTFAVCAILLAVIVVINLLVGLIPSKMTVFDTSANKLYTVSDASKKFLGKLSEDVNLRKAVAFTKNIIIEEEKPTTMAWA